MIRVMYVSDGVAFFGRRALLSTLQGRLDEVVQSGRGQILALRGRRQVGKSTVIERFIDSAGVPSVFVTAVFGAAHSQHLADATAALTEARTPLPHAELLTQSRAASWREWFGRVALAAQQGPVVAVLDEFPWFIAADDTLEGELQIQWDRVLEKLPVLLVLIGSDVAMMERLATHGRPLFGRVRPLVVQALNPGEVAEALPGLPPKDVFDGYLVTGGYPRLVADLARSNTSPTAFVRASLRDSYSPLVTTARLTLDAEFADAAAAYQVLSAIGSEETGQPRFSDLVGSIDDAAERNRVQTAITRSLKTLTEGKGLVVREQPAWAPPSARLARYRIADPYLRFWFRYVERQVDAIARGRADLAVDAFDRDWSSWRGRSIEPVVRDALTRLAGSDPHLAGVEEVKPWWVRNNAVGVDAVAMSRSASVLVATIKWRTGGSVTDRDVARLRAHRELVPRAERALLAVISPSGKKPAGADVAYGATELLAGWSA